MNFQTIVYTILLNDCFFFSLTQNIHAANSYLHSLYHSTERRWNHLQRGMAYRRQRQHLANCRNSFELHSQCRMIEEAVIRHYDAFSAKRKSTEMLKKTDKSPRSLRIRF